MTENKEPRKTTNSNDERSMTDYVTYQKLFSKRLSLLVSALEEMPIPKTAPFASLNYLRDLLADGEGHLSGLEVEIHEAILNASDRRIRMSYDLSGQPKTLKLDHRLMDAFDKVGNWYGNERLPGIVDCFLIHEFLHYAQGMGHGRHSGLSSQAPNTLLAIDYQADAMAVISIAMLATLRPDNYGINPTADGAGLWSTYRHAIKLALGQMEVFTHLGSRDLDRAVVSGQRFSLDKLQRTAVWQYQYHRARGFNRERSWADFQILSQPHLHFRNLEAAWAHDKKLISKKWPEDGERMLVSKFNKRSGYELRPQDDPFCILAAPSQYGTTRFVRIAASKEIGRSLFEALFDGNVENSKVFFDPLFQTEPWLTGHVGGDDYGGPGGGDPEPQPLPPDPGGWIKDLSEDERLALLNIYLQSPTFPLVVMGVEPELA